MASSSSSTSLPSDSSGGRPTHDNARVSSPRSSTSSDSRPSSSTKRAYLGKKDSMNGPLYMQSYNKTVLVRRLKRKGDGLSKQLARWFVENQIGTPAPSLCLPGMSRIEDIGRENFLQDALRLHRLLTSPTLHRMLRVSLPCTNQPLRPTTVCSEVRLFLRNC